MFRTFATAAAAAALSAMPTTAPAGDVLNYYFNHAASVCQPALPAFDGLIRKRPKALVNEGTATAYITCGLGNQSAFLHTVNYVGVQLSSAATGPVTASCALVDGQGEQVHAPTLVKSTIIDPGGSGYVDFDNANDNGGTYYSFPSLSCLLPPGTAITGVSYVKEEDIGP